MRMYINIIFIFYHENVRWWTRLPWPKQIDPKKGEKARACWRFGCFIRRRRLLLHHRLPASSSQSGSLKITLIKWWWVETYAHIPICVTRPQSSPSSRLAQIPITTAVPEPWTHTFIYTCVYTNIIEMIYPKPQIFNLAAFDTYIYIYIYIYYT